MANSEETQDSAVEAEAPTSFSTETPVTAEVAEKKPRKPLTVGGHAVGRRKQAIARVRLVPGSGSYTVNGRTLEEYFPNKLHQQLINDPFTILELGGSYDVIARITGGGPSGHGRRRHLRVFDCSGDAFEANASGVAWNLEEGAVTGGDDVGIVGACPIVDDDSVGQLPMGAQIAEMTRTGPAPSSIRF